MSERGHMHAVVRARFENVSPSSRVLAELVENFEVGSSWQGPHTDTARAPVELVRASHDVRADLEHNETRKIARL